MVVECGYYFLMIREKMLVGSKICSNSLFPLVLEQEHEKRRSSCDNQQAGKQIYSLDLRLTVEVRF